MYSGILTTLIASAANGFLATIYQISGSQIMNGFTPTILRFVPAHFAALFTLYFYETSCHLITVRKICLWTAPAPGLIPSCFGGAVSLWAEVTLTILALSLEAVRNHHAGLIGYSITNGLLISIGVLILHERITTRRLADVAFDRYRCCVWLYRIEE